MNDTKTNPSSQGGLLAPKIDLQMPAQKQLDDTENGYFETLELRKRLAVELCVDRWSGYRRGVSRN